MQEKLYLHKCKERLLELSHKQDKIHKVIYILYKHKLFKIMVRK